MVHIDACVVAYRFEIKSIFLFSGRAGDAPVGAHADVQEEEEGNHGETGPGQGAQQGRQGTDGSPGTSTAIFRAKWEWEL